MGYRSALFYAATVVFLSGDGDGVGAAVERSVPLSRDPRVVGQKWYAPLRGDGGRRVLLLLDTADAVFFFGTFDHLRLILTFRWGRSFGFAGFAQDDTTWGRSWGDDWRGGAGGGVSGGQRGAEFRGGRRGGLFAAGAGALDYVEDGSDVG